MAPGVSEDWQHYVPRQSHPVHLHSATVQPLGRHLEGPYWATSWRGLVVTLLSQACIMVLLLFLSRDPLGGLGKPFKGNRKERCILGRGQICLLAGL